ncbi:hypothetical protein C8J56DRAFT_777893 [Mycena floridula]|nr:hypothetical protein C8J56DRAFT_777893 [Mycena floridula]
MIQRHIEGYQSLLAPIRKMPPEILRSNFQTCLRQLGAQDVGFYIPGLKIAQVCSSWRAISFSANSLWSIYFSMPMDADRISSTVARGYHVSAQAVRQFPAQNYNVGAEHTTRGSGRLAVTCSRVTSLV